MKKLLGLVLALSALAIPCIVLSASSALTVPVKASASVYKVKLFSRAINSTEMLADFEDSINNWLEQNTGKIEIYMVNQSNSGRSVIQVTVWYKEQSTRSAYRAKVFMDTLVDGNRLDALESSINQWLESQRDKILITAMSQGSSSMLRVDLIVWYKTDW